jgi:hypothetical protein
VTSSPRTSQTMSEDAAPLDVGNASGALKDITFGSVSLWINEELRNRLVLKNRGRTRR